MQVSISMLQVKVEVRHLEDLLRNGFLRFLLFQCMVPMSTFVGIIKWGNSEHVLTYQVPVLPGPVRYLGTYLPIFKCWRAIF